MEIGNGEGNEIHWCAGVLYHLRGAIQAEQVYQLVLKGLRIGLSLRSKMFALPVASRRGKVFLVGVFIWSFQVTIRKEHLCSSPTAAEPQSSKRF